MNPTCDVLPTCWSNCCQGYRVAKRIASSSVTLVREEADYVETLIRRRNGVVYRDEEDFEPAAETQEEIIKNIKRSNVFVAIWCKEYACSSWCFDELELAIQRRKEGLSELWIFCVDDTRIGPRDAKRRIYYNVNSREGRERRKYFT